MRPEFEDGGPAFPKSDIHDSELGLILNADGMSLRDYFAASALQGIMHSWGEVEGWEHNVTWAYKYADAMLKARKEAKP